MSLQQVLINLAEKESGKQLELYKKAELQ